VSELGSGDKLNAVYSEKLVSSAPYGDKGYVRGELAVARDELGNTQDVYLGAEEDDESAEQRNEDRFNDDDREYDQDGREFIKIRPIIWRRQFLARHGDPGLNVYKFIERLIRGLIPKLAADTRLQKALAGTTLKSILKGELAPGTTSKNTDATTAGTTDPLGKEPGVKGVAHRMAGGIKGAAHAVKDQAKLVEMKVLHHAQPEDEALKAASVRTPSAASTTSTTPATPAYVREGDELEANTPKASPSTMTRPVHGQDADFNKSELVIAGGLETVWQGRHRITSLFRRWKLWHVEIKGDTIYYHRTNSLSAASAADAVWYTLDLTWIQDMYLTDSHREQNNELVLRFVQDDNTLHFRLPNKMTTPTLQEWLTAMRRVQSVQQERNRLGYSGLSQSPRATTTWPGEDAQHQPRSRGSSLSVPPVRDVNLVTPSKTATFTPTKTSTSTEGLVMQQPDTSYGQVQPPLNSSMVPSATRENTSSSSATTSSAKPIVPPVKPQSELHNMSAQVDAAKEREESEKAREDALKSSTSTTTAKPLVVEEKSTVDVVVPPNKDVNVLVPASEDVNVVDKTKGSSMDTQAGSTTTGTRSPIQS
jgi:hypothetical protein